MTAAAGRAGAERGLRLAKTARNIRENQRNNAAARV
jgi:hypothetical protein